MLYFGGFKGQFVLEFLARALFKGSLCYPDGKDVYCM